jgi:hypothetical protein
MLAGASARAGRRGGIDGDPRNEWQQWLPTPALEGTPWEAVGVGGVTTLGRPFFSTYPRIQGRRPGVGSRCVGLISESGEIGG